MTSKTEAQRPERRRREVRMEKEDGAKSRGCAKEVDLSPELWEAIEAFLGRVRWTWVGKGGELTQIMDT